MRTPPSVMVTASLCARSITSRVWFSKLTLVAACAMLDRISEVG